jgi:peptidoglycan/xylan/chitin deacetylase (PgdA/CDA1 family)
MRNFINISIDTEKDLGGKGYEGVIKGIPRLVNILNKHQVKSTFFVTGDVLIKFPHIFKKLKKQGHEIALHGYSHKRFDNMSEKEIKEELVNSLACFKKYLKNRPVGFRAPQHSINKDTLKLLSEKGFIYDSSMIPWNFHHIINNLLGKKTSNRFSYNFKPFWAYDIFGLKLKEVPITSFIFPLSAFTIRILPSNIFKFYLKIIKLFRHKVFFMHSWDFIKLKDSRLYNRCPLPEFLKRFEYTVKFFSKDRFLTIEKAVS